MHKQGSTCSQNLFNSVDAFMSVFMEHKVAFIGFGEAASAFVKGWNKGPSETVIAYDIKTDHDSEAVRNGKWSDYEQAGVVGCTSLRDVLKSADVIFSLVTADQAAGVARDAAELIKKDAFFFDCNSCAPGTKSKSAVLIETAGARYVDVAVMAPVYPKLHHTPVSLSGPHVDGAKVIFDAMDMKASIVEGDVGAASSIKMIRSIMMKGMEALFAECVLAGRKAGVEDVVLDSLDKTYPGFDFKEKAAYMLERSMTHGIRRAAEMREVAITVDDLGLQGDMARATVEWQQRIGDLQVKAEDGETYQERADRLLAALTQQKGSR
jgi:3-hydroxyisobutyrate dehydrogenase-like beta-hydroxyacid dehydrogenase